MNFDYQMTEKDETYFLKERHRKTNLVYFVLFALFYFILNISLLMNDFWLFITIYFFFILLLALLLYGCNFLFTFIELKIRQKDRKEGYLKYHFSVTKRGITQSTDKFKKEVLWKDIKKIHIRRNYVFIEPKNDEIAFLFRKSSLNEYYKLIEMLNQNKNNQIVTK